VRIEAHSGQVELQHPFGLAHAWLTMHGPLCLKTSRGKPFTAEASIVTKGTHASEQVIVFRTRGVEYARAYRCCWGTYYNCNRTRIGMYCGALDGAIDNSSL